MDSDKKTAQYLGIAFLIQIIAPIVSDLLLNPLIVDGNITETLIRISNNPLQLQASILIMMITVFGIATIGALMYIILQKENKPLATVAFGFYLIEASILAVSRISGFALFLVSKESVLNGHPAYLQSLGNLFLELQNFGFRLHMLPFAIGALMFYYLFYKSKVIPRNLAILGLIAAPTAILGSVMVLLGVDIPIIVFLPSLPFELLTGLWLIGKKVPDESVRKP
jgi:hypothetical protein